MPIYELLQSFTNKQSKTYSSFLQAYSNIKEIKNLPENLSIISDCMVSDKSNKCLSYYINNDMDRVILQLQDHFDIEPFFISILKIFDQKYLKSEFFRVIWKYKKYNRLAFYYGEMCVIHNVFNREFSYYLLEMFYLSKDIRESLVIVSKMQEYQEFFIDMGFGMMVVSKCNCLIEMNRNDSIEMLEFLCYYQDVTNIDLLSQIIFSINSENGLDFLLEIFVKIKSNTIRKKILVNSKEYCTSKGYSEFIIACIEEDPNLMSTIFKVSNCNDEEWCPLKLTQLLLKEEEDADIDDIHVFFKKFNNAMKTVPSKCYNIIEYLLKSNNIDIRIFIFLYIVDRRSFYLNIDNILQKSSEKGKIVSFVKHDILEVKEQC